MQALLYANLSSQTISGTPTGSTFSWPALVEGSDLVLSFRLLKGLGAAAQEVQRNIVRWQALIGKPDSRPTSGTVELKLGTAPPVAGVNLTAPLAVAGLNAAQIQSAVNALTGLSTFHPCTVKEQDGSYFITGSDGGLMNFTLGENSTFPLSFLRVSTALVDGAHAYALRLVQAPAALTDQQSRVAPLPPVVEEVISGSSADGSQRNAVQKITFAPNSRFLYTIGYGGNQTATLKLGSGTSTDPSDGVPRIAAALNAIAPADGSFAVTNPDTGVAVIEFIGPLGAQPQDLLTVSVYGAPLGDVTCTLSLDTYPLGLLLNAEPKQQITLPLEVTCVLEDEHDPGIHVEHVLIRTSVTILRRLGSPTLGTAPEIDYALPPLPADYLPYNRSQVGIGSFSYPEVIGNGLDHVFLITHGQNSDLISNLNVLRNTTPGAALIPGADFTWRRMNRNVIELTITGAVPAADALEVIITFAQVRSQFIEGVTFELGQVNGLSRALADITGRLSTVERIVAITGGGTAPAKGAPEIVMTADLPTKALLFPWRDISTLPVITDLAKVDLSKYRSLGLLGAVHSAIILPLPSGEPEPGPAYIGKVYRNQTSTEIQLAGGLGHKGPKIPPGGYVLCDGRIWYAAVRYGAENSFYPLDFEQRLFTMPIDSDELTVGRTLSIDFAIQLAVMKANTNWQWVLELRHAVPTAVTAPTGTGYNFKDLVWNTTPILSKQLLVTDEPRTRVYGLRIARSIQRMSGTPTDTFTTSIIKGGVTSGAPGPASAPFVIGAFLCRGDTEDSVSSPVGFAGMVFPSPPNVAGTATNLGKAIIASGSQ